MHRVSRPTFDVSPQQGHFVPQRSTLQITALKLKYYRPKKAKYRLHSTHGGESCEKQRLACYINFCSYFSNLFPFSNNSSIKISNGTSFPFIISS